MGMLPKDAPVSCYSLTGYSGGGKKMIAQYEGDKTEDLFSPRTYSLGLDHKHLPEMIKYAGLKHPPVFCPVVDDYYKGMETVVMLENRFLKGTPTAEDVCEMLAAYYEGRRWYRWPPLAGIRPRWRPTPWQGGTICGCMCAATGTVPW